MSSWRDYLGLIKPGILKHALMTFATGYFLAAYPEKFDLLYLVKVGIGFACIASSAASLNHIIERLYDKLMERTQNRPLVTQSIRVSYAYIFSAILAVVGTAVLVSMMAYKTLFVAWVMLITYNWVYTPLKRVTWMNTFVGSLPGALPPVCGWLAVSSMANVMWVAFGVFFIWQIPHFFALAWKYREQYEKAGFKMLPPQDDSGKKVGLYMILTTTLLMGLVIYLSAISILGWIFLAGATCISLGFMYTSIVFYQCPSELSARKVFIASILYQPILLFLIVMDRLIEVFI